MKNKGLLSRFLPKKNTNLTDEDRQFALEIRRMNQIDRLKERQLESQNRLLQLKEEQMKFLNNIGELGTGKDSADDMIGNFMQLLLASKMQQPQQETATTPLPTPEEPAPITGQQLTDEQIQELIDKIPKTQKKMAASLDDSTLAAIIHGKMPGFNAATIGRAIELFRSD